MNWILPALGFAILWIWVFYREDKRPEPLGMVLAAFALGVGGFGIAWIVEFLVAWHWTVFKEDTLLAHALLAFLVIGPVEEGVKFLLVLLILLPLRFFDEPMDGILYSAVVATGFAFAENLLLAKGSPALMWLRGLSGTMAHILFAGYWGSALGWLKVAAPSPKGWLIVLASLVGSIVAHGLFDLVVFSFDRQLSAPVARALIGLLLVASFLLLRWQMKGFQRLQEVTGVSQEGGKETSGCG